MGAISVTNNASITIQLAKNYADTGWSITNAIATHSSCNSGYIINSGLQLQIGTSYQVTYTVSGWSSGYVQPFVGTAGGTQRSANGVYTDTITCTGNTTFSFYSNGDLSISIVSVAIPNAVSNYTTIGFNEARNRWTSQYSFDPEWMVDYNQSLFSFKSGALWKHESTNVTRNNFYGTQANSKVTSLVNGMSNGEAETSNTKIFFGVRVDSNGVWYAPNITTTYNDNYAIGQASMLGSGNMIPKEGLYYADFLRDINDPQFPVLLDALFKGRQLRGKQILLQFQCDLTTESRLKNIEVYYAISERNQ